MKKAYLISIILIFCLIIVNFFYFKRLSRNQFGYKQELLLGQTHLCGNYVEEILGDFQSDLNRILYRNSTKLNSIFQKPQEMGEFQQELESFYSNYREFITNISVYDNHNSYMGIYVTDGDGFVVDTFSRQTDNRLESREMVSLKNGFFYTHLPYFYEDELRGNVVVEIDFIGFIKKIFNLYKIDDFQWQWLITDSGQVLFTNNSTNSEIAKLDGIADSIRNQSEGTLLHTAVIEGTERDIASAYYPLNLLNNKMGIVFSLYQNKQADILYKNIFLAIINMVLFIALIVFIIRELYKKHSSVKKLSCDLLKNKLILEKIPVGILVMDKENKIKLVNLKAQELFQADNVHELIGKNSKTLGLNPDMAQVGSQDGSSTNNQVIIKSVDGSELYVFKKEAIAHIAGEEMKINSLFILNDIPDYLKIREEMMLLEYTGKEVGRTKGLNFSKIKHFNEISALILSRSRNEEDRIHRVLDSFGINYVYRLYETNTANETILHLRQKKKLYQLLIIKDKPGDEGISIAKKIKESNLSKQYIIVFISSNNQQGNYQKTLHLDIDYYIIKPYVTAEILNILNELFPSVVDKKGIAPYIYRIRPDLKILTAENDPINQRRIQVIFHNLGYETELVNDGEKLLLKLASENYDILFMDLQIQGMDGISSFKKIGSLYNNLPVIALSEGESELDRQSAKEAGINGFLVKPLRIESVKEVLIGLFSEPV